MPRESMQYDIVVVGAGPAGLAAAIRIKQLSAETSVCVLEKGSEVGAHILSGAVMDPIAITELIPDWKAKGAPLNTPVSEDRFLFLTEGSSLRTPNFLLPPCFQNHGNYVVSLGNVTRWLGQQAEALGVEIFPGLRRAGNSLRRQYGQGRRHRRHGNRQERRKDRRLPAGHGAARQVHLLRRRLPRPSRPPARGEAGPARRRRPAGLRHRHQGAVGGEAGEAPGRAGRPHRRLAARSRRLRRLVPLSPGRQPGRRRLRRRPGLPEPLPLPVRGVPALQDPSGDPEISSKAESASPTARARSRPEGCSRCRSWCSRAAR